MLLECERVQALADELEIALEHVPAVALRFCLSHPAVATVIAGMRSVRHVDANACASNAGPLEPEQVERLRRHRWLRNFYRAREPAELTHPT